MIDDVERYFDAVTRATSCEGPDALGAWEEVVALNPCNAVYWSQLASGRDANGDYGAAIDAYQRAIELGATYPAESAFNIARCWALLDRPEQALLGLSRALAMGYRDIARAQSDPELASLHALPGFGDLVGLIDRETVSRTDGWAHDLAFLGREVGRKSHHVIRALGIGDFEDELDRLASRVPELSDAAMYAELMRLVASLGDGHSHFSVPDDWTARALPLSLFLFEEGLYIVGAHPDYRDMLGTRLVRLGDRPIQEILDSLRPYVSSDNEMTIRQRVPNLLRATWFLHAIGLVIRPDRVEVTTSSNGGNRSQTTLVTTVNERSFDTRWRIAPMHEDWIAYPRRATGSPVPLSQRNPSVMNWFDHLPDHRAVYFQFCGVRDSEHASLAQVSKRLSALVETDAVERLIIDVRWNGGGDTFLELPLLHYLWASEKLRRPGSLFVLIGRSTFSACQNFVTLLERFGRPIFVGEPTGSSPNFVGETVTCELPYSRSKVTISDLYWQGSWPTDYRTWVSPHVYFPVRFAAFAENVDPALELALAAPSERFEGWTRVAPAARGFPRDWP